MRPIVVLTAGTVFLMGALSGADGALARAASSHHAASSAGSTAMKSCASQWQAMKKAGTAKGSYQDFSKTCMSGKGAASSTPAAAAPAAKSAKAAKSSATGATTAAPAAVAGSKTTPTTHAKTATAANTDATNATAKCKDGTYSHAATHSGACSGHGGVAQWLKP